jgi:general stress protein 26
VSGAARVVEDPVKKKELWSAAAKAWFPGGVDDPDLALVAVLVAEADYWDVKANKAVQIFKLAKAAVTGKAPTDLAEHRRVRMR